MLGDGAVNIGEPGECQMILRPPVIDLEVSPAPLPVGSIESLSPLPISAGLVPVLVSRRDRSRWTSAAPLALESLRAHAG